MTIARVTSPYEGVSSVAAGAHSVTNVTIPAGATSAVITFGGYQNAARTFSAVTLDGQSATLIDSHTADDDADHLWAFFVTGFGSGANKTLAWALSGALSEGLTIVIEFQSGVDVSNGATSAVRDSGTGSSGESPGTASYTVTTQVGDLILCCYTCDASSPTFGSGQTAGGEAQAGSFTHGGISYETAAGTSDTQSATSNFPAIVALSLVPAAAGGGGSELVVADASHGHSADNVDLVQGYVLAVDDASHGHAADNVDLTQAGTLIVADALHGQAADSLSLTQANVLFVEDASHDQAAGNIVLTVAGTLEVADASHAHTADALNLTQAHLLAVADALHDHAADSVTLSLADILAVADALHAHAVDNVALTQAHVLTIAEALHAQSAANVVLTQGFALSVDDAAHAQTAESPTLSLANILVVADAIHAHTADEVELTQAHVLVVSNALHAHLADLLALQLPSDVPPSVRVFRVEAANRTFLVARGNRTFQA